MIRQVIDWTYDRDDRNLLRELRIALDDQSANVGFLWSVLHPVLMAAILIAVVRDRLGSDINHFEVYVLVGIAPFVAVLWFKRPPAEGRGACLAHPRCSRFR